MKKITFAVMGMGSRGTKYAEKQFKYPDEMEVVAIADTQQKQLDHANKYLKLPEDRLFHSAEEMLEQPKMADVMVVATQDAQHRDHAIKAMELGYDLLLEKPIAPNAEDCKAIVEAAHKYNRKVIVCHVLRYTIFYQTIKKLIDDGVLGDIQTVQAEEQVGHYHQAHSFVRGNWHNSKESCPMILAKCCHDMDLLLWLTGKKCQKVSSFGSLRHFNAANKPEGSAARCVDCKVADSCIYNAPKFYLSRMPGWPTYIIHPEPTEEIVMEAMRTTDYGRCVYDMDNDVVDSQTVNMLMDDGSTVNFTMSGFTNRQTRSIHIMGTKGDLVGDFKSRTYSLRLFGQEEQEVDLTPLYDDFTGHGGGDGRLVYDVIRYLRGDDFDSSSITVIDRSTESHYLAFAAEQARLEQKVIDMDEFVASL